MKKLFVIFLLLIVSPAFATSQDSLFVRTTREGDVVVQPYAALCTIHAYNVGRTQNPEAGEADARAEMEQVVALKTTLITKEMKKQYDFLETTMRRLETQLQKAVLVSKIEAAGGAPSSSSGSGGGGGGSYNSSRGVGGAEDCRSRGATKEVMICIQKNVGLASAALSKSPSGNIKYQLDEDVKTFLLYSKLTGEAGAAVTKEINTKCANMNVNRADLQNCINIMNVGIVRNLEQIENENRPRGINF